MIGINIFYNPLGGCFFFGTPHDGLRTEELEKTIADLNAKFANNPEEQRWRRDLIDFIRNLSPGSDYLERLRDDVAKMLNGFPEGSIVSFYETVRTNTTRSVSFLTPVLESTLLILADRWGSDRKRRSPGYVG
jgi:hypothetical protein